MKTNETKPSTAAALALLGGLCLLTTSCGFDSPGSPELGPPGKGREMSRIELNRGNRDTYGRGTDNTGAYGQDRSYGGMSNRGTYNSGSYNRTNR